MNSHVHLPKLLRCLSVLMLAWASAAQLPAQSDREKPKSRMAEGFALRAELTQALVTGKLKSEEAIEKLRAASSPVGIGLEKEAEFALAAIDLGQRLLASKKALEAEPFFAAAEKTLGILIDQTPDRSTGQKVMYLEQRAFVRNRFLNKTPEADEDLANAIKLKPEEERLNRARASLPAAKANRKEEPTKS